MNEVQPSGKNNRLRPDADEARKSGGPPTSRAFSPVSGFVPSSCVQLIGHKPLPSLTATARVSTWGEALAAPPGLNAHVTPLGQSRDADPVRQRSPRAIFDAETPGQPAFPEQILTG